MANVKIRATYGEIEVTGFDGCWRREIYRPDVMPAERWNREVSESTMVASHADYSPRHSMREYNSECSCCWLNITHSEALHVRKAGG